MKYRRFLFSMRNKYIALRNINILKKFYWKTQTQTSGSKITDWYKPYLSWTWKLSRQHPIGKKIFNPYLGGLSRD